MNRGLHFILLLPPDPDHAKRGDHRRSHMGEPILEGRQIPVNLDGPVKDFPLKIADRVFTITCVSMGNPHAVNVVDDVDSVDLKQYGPLIERHELFPRRINVEFIQVIDRGMMRMRVWERGAGETLACGTGACAAAVTGILRGLVESPVSVSTRGGDLRIAWDGPGRPVMMTGPAASVFQGEIAL